jgi:hypothetical protein
MSKKDEKEEDKLKIKKKFYFTEKNIYIFSLWNIWYCLLILILNIYLINRRVHDLINLIKNSTNYLKLKSTETIIINNNNNNNKNDSITTTPTTRTTNMFILSTSILFNNNNLFIEYLTRCLLIGFAILFFILFIITQFKKIGNYANDDFKFGTNFIKEKLKLKAHLFKPQQQQQQDEQKKRNCLSITGKMIILSWRHFLPINSLCHLLNAVSILLPSILFHNIKCFNSESNKTSIIMLICPFNGVDYDNLNLTRFLNDNLFEVINFLFAICLLYIRYSLVFWLANKTLTFLLSLLGLITCIEQLFQIYSLFYLNLFFFFDNYQQQNDVQFQLIQPHSSVDLLLKTKFSINFLYFLLAILVFFSLTPIYMFIYLKYREKYFSEDYKIRQRRQAIIGSGDMNRIRTKGCFNTYFIHLCAAIQLILITACKIPFCYDYIILYNLYKDFGIMISSIVNILCLITFILIWLILTLKVDWNINFKLQFRICHRLVAYDNRNFYINEILEQIEDGRIQVIDDDNDDDVDVEDGGRKQVNEAKNKAKTTTTTTTTTTIATAAILSGFVDEMPKTLSSPAIISTSTPSIRPHNFIGLSKLAPVTTGETLTTNTITTTASSNNDFSETLYRNEIRKSIKNILNSQLNKKPGSSNDATDYFNNRRNMIASGIYLSSSSSSSGTTTNGNNDLTIISTISDNNNNKSKKSSITGVGSIKYKPFTRRPVIYLDRHASYTNTQTIVTNPNELLNKIQFNKINSNGEIIEFESRV